ncbi:MAG: hypothetical protein ACSHXI_02615 [Hoeflea sp.]|uniref:hypothetical protein n=1 Tax=Hoeflea sp. TaxID=1940281 RepID=UPI003EF322B1
MEGFGAPWCFGAGACSIGFLKRFLIDDPLNDATMRCFVEVAGVLGIQIVAEYVGDDKVMAKLEEMDVDFRQGFHIHKREPPRK